MDDPAKNVAAVNTSHSLGYCKYQNHCPKGKETWSGRKRNPGLWQTVSGIVPRILRSYVNSYLNQVAITDKVYFSAFPYGHRLTFHTKASHRMNPLPSHYLGEAESPVKPLQCRSVTTHLFGQLSLASLSDCSLSSQHPALFTGAKIHICTGLFCQHTVFGMFWDV